MPAFAYAHIGIGAASGFMSGLAHPLSGLDHVCAMLAVGLWAVQMGGRSVWAVPLTFVSVMVLGSALPVLNPSLPFIEQGIVLSVLLLGVLIAASIRLPLWLGSGMAGLFALWHGYAHGVEIPASSSSMGYALGFVLTTVLLHVTGIVLGLGIQRLPALDCAEGTRKRIVNLTGASIALCGAYLAVA